MHPNDLFDIIGFLLVIALVAVILTKQNTAQDLKAAGGAFTGSVRQAEAG